MLHAQSLQLCLTLCSSMDCSLPGSSVHRILQARILEWVAMCCPRGSSWPGLEPTSFMSPALAGRFFTTSATWKAQSIPLVFNKNNENINDSLVAQLVKNPPATEEITCNAGDLGSLPGFGRSPGGRHGNPLQYSCLENPMDRGAWWAIVREVTKSWTWLSDFHFHLIERGADPASVVMMTTRGQTRASLEYADTQPSF